MRDQIVLLCIYGFAVVLALTGIVSLKRQAVPKNRDKRKAPVAVEDMLDGWGKEEEESKR